MTIMNILIYFKGKVTRFRTFKPENVNNIKPDLKNKKNRTDPKLGYVGPVLTVILMLRFQIK